MKQFTFNLGNTLREAGFNIHELGRKLQASAFYDAPLSKHRRLMSLDGIKPNISQGAWIAPSASVIGQVELGSNSSVWYGSVVRGDVNLIKIGSKTNIQDRVVIHASSGETIRNTRPPIPTVIGNNVTVEAGSILHACTVEDNAKIEIGSKILDGAKVGACSVVAAGSLVGPGKVIPSGELWAGSPAQFVRKLSQEEIDAIKVRADDMYRLAMKHDAEHSKTNAQIEQDRELEEEWEDSTAVQPNNAVPPITVRGHRV